MLSSAYHPSVTSKYLVIFSSGIYINFDFLLPGGYYFFGKKTKTKGKESKEEKYKVNGKGKKERKKVEKLVKEKERKYERKHDKKVMTWERNYCEKS